MLVKMTTLHGLDKAILKKLPAYETYEIFEKNTDSSDYISKCNSLGSIGNETKNLCEKYARNLQSICKTGSTTITSTASTSTTSAPSSTGAPSSDGAPSSGGPPSSDGTPSNGAPSSTAASTTVGTTVLTPTVSTSVPGTSETTAAENSINVPEAKAKCLLLKYWLFNKIRELSDNKLKGKNLDTLFHTIYHLQFEINKKEDKVLCFNDIYEYLHNWKEEKYLYEYFKNFPKIESFNKTNTTECEAYKKYVNHAKSYYNEKKEKDLCCKDNYFKCSDYFNCDPKYNPEKILNKISRTNTTAEGASVSGSTPNSDKAKETPKTRIENHRCIVRRHPTDPHLAYLSCFNVPTVYKNVDDYFPATDTPKGETGDNSKGKDATSPESSREGSQPTQEQIKRSEEPGSDSLPKVNILDQVKSLLGLGKYIRNIIDTEYPIIIPGNKTKIKNGITYTSTTPEYAKKVQIENTEENFDLLKSSDNFFNTKPFKSIMTAILTFGVIFVFFIYYKFTPFGSCLSRRFQKKRKTPPQIQEINTKPVPKRSQKNQNINTKTGRARIAYHPT
ncbi:PIR protein [Plasmodium vivax]|uniref:VIR protein n=1 Tax=Plasmodium vivax TaxID=5855 RepID=A0A564ZPN8_PLAVI|nr:PIR protein [Plasmodium vivax]